MSDKRKDPFAPPAALQRQLQDAMRPFADMQKKLQEAMRPAAELQKKIRAIQVPVIRTQEFDRAVRRIIEEQKAFAKEVERWFGPIEEVAKKLAQAGRNTKALEDTGWLPHYSTPFSLIEECEGDIDALRTRLSQYYQDQWREVRKDVESRLARYDIDGEAKATFREALDAHEARCYRSVCRVLLPEIERVARIELHGGKLDRITDQPLLRKLAGNLTPASIEPRGYYGLTLFQRLTEHLYEHVKNEADRMRFAQDPVPNRHAAIHGLVVYSSMQNSLNAIFMTDYVFQVINFLKSETL